MPLRNWLIRFPMTLTLATGILVMAVVTGAVRHPLSPELVARWGFGLPDLRSGELWRLVTAPWLVLRPAMILSIEAAVLFLCGAAEWLAGTRRTLVASGAGQLAGCVLAPLLLDVLGRFGLTAAAAMAPLRDVGASNIAFGAAGLAVSWLPPFLRRRGTTLVGLGLLLALIISARRWDVGHALAFPAGLATGLVWLRVGGGRLSEVRRRPDRHEGPSVLALTVGAMGAINVLSVAFHRPAAHLPRLEPWLPGHPAGLLILASGLVLLVLAPAIARGRRLAWSAAVVVLAASFALHLPRHGTRTEPLLVLAVLAVLLAWAPAFTAPSDVDSLRRGRAILLMTLVVLPLAGVAAIRIWPAGFAGPRGFEASLREVGSWLIFSPHAVLVPVTTGTRLLALAIPVAGWALVLSALALVLRGVGAEPRTTTDLELARRLVLEHGSGETAYMTLWPGNAFVFGPERRGFVGYRLAADVALALGDPIGPEQARRVLIEAFTTATVARGWDPVFYAATEECAEHYRAAGYDLLQIAEEARIPLEDLSFKGRSLQDVRTAINRARREEVDFQMFEGGTVPPHLRRQLDEISAEWEAGRGLPPLGFTLGRTEDVDNPDLYVALAVDRAGRVLAFVDWLPVPARRGWVVDLMRRRRQAAGGVMDFLVAMSMLAFQERGYREVSLGAAPLADTDRDGSTSPLLRALAFAYRHLDTFYHFQSLFAYKEKFRPRWRPVYLAYRGEEVLGRAARAIVLAYLPGLNLTALARLLGR